MQLSGQSSENLDSLKDQGDYTIVGTIVAAETTKTNVCLNCKDQKLQWNNNSAIVTCPKCKVSMLKKNLNVQLSCNVMIRDETENTTERLYCPMKMLQDFFSSAELTDSHMKDDLVQIPQEKVTATLLNLENIKFEVSKDKKTVNYMKQLEYKFVFLIYCH